VPLRAYYLDPPGNLRCGLGEPEIKAAFESKQGLLWVDIVETNEEDAEFLDRVFHFHHLAIDDCLSPRIHQPKIDDFSDHLFIIVHGINHMSESEVVDTTELEMFLGSHFVVSNHNFPMYSVESVIQSVEDDGRPMRRGADFLCHALIDALIDNVMPTTDTMEERADEIEEEIVRKPEHSVLETILQLKRSTLRLHRVMAPQREVMNRLSRREFNLVSADAAIFYRDLYDHIVRIEDLNQTLRDRADNFMQIYVSSVANRQNETMKVLTTVATIFMPLTLLASLYGMNFTHIPMAEREWGFYAVIGCCLVAITVSFSLLWARQWITVGSKVKKVRPFAVKPEKLAGYLEQVASRSPLRGNKRNCTPNQPNGTEIGGSPTGPPET
jgi:magnesium transporter